MTQNATSILAVDCGTVTTNAILLDQIKDSYRFVAQGKALSTYGPPWHNVTLGVIEAIKQIQQETRRQLLTKANTPLMAQNNSVQGLEAFTVVSSAAPPLSILLAGLMTDISLQVARQAIATTYSTIVHQLFLDDKPKNRNPEYRVSIIQNAQIDAILLIGGIDGGASTPIIDLAYLIATALKGMHGKTRPTILYAGNTQLRPILAQVLGKLTTFKSINNILPTLKHQDINNLQIELDNLYLKKRISQLPEFDTLAKWASNRVAPTARSFIQTIHYIGQSYNIDTIMGVNIGNTSTTIATRAKDIHHNVNAFDSGIGYNLPALLEQTKIEDFQRWLPFDISPIDLNNFLYNKALFPQTVSQSYQELLQELSAIREALRLAHHQIKCLQPQLEPQLESQQHNWFNWNLIIGSGQALTNLPYHSLALLALLDGLQPSGICNLALDTNNLMPIMGAVASIKPLAAVQVTEHDAFLNLGVVIAPIGVGRLDEIALKFKITYQDDRELEKEIPFGTLEIIPLNSGEKASLEIEPTRNFSFDVTGETMGHKISAVVEGGTLGIIIDTRGRPIKLATDNIERYKQNQEWLVKLGLPPGATNTNLNQRVKDDV